MIKEYETTTGEYEWEHRIVGMDDWTERRADRPVPPDGDGWECIGMCAADGLLFWSWEREVPS